MPANVIDSLVALLGFELDPGSEQAKEQYNSTLDTLTGNVKKAGAFAIATGAALATLGGGFAILAGRTAEGTDELGKFSAATGIAFDEVQKLIFAGGIFGASQNEVVAALGNVQDKLAEFKRGQGDFQVLGEIGVSTDGADAVTFIERLANRFSQFSEERAQELGKKLGLDQNFIALLQSGTANLDQLRAEFVELGGVISNEGAANAANFNDAMFRMRTIINSVRDRVVLALLPAFTAAATSVSDFVKNNRELIEQGLSTFIETVVFLLQQMATVIAQAISLWSDFVSIVGGVGNAVTLLGIGFVAFQLATSASLIKVIRDIQKVGLAATLANSKILLVPILLGAAFAVALVAIQDFYYFFTGRESLIGDIVDSFREWREELQEMKPIVDALLIPLDKLVAVGERLGIFAGQVAVGEFSSNLSAIGNDISQGNFGNLGGFTLDQFNALGNFLNPFSGDGGGNTSSAEINFNVEVQGTGNLEQAGREVVKGAASELGTGGHTILVPITQ